MNNSEREKTKIVLYWIKSKPIEVWMKVFALLKKGNFYNRFQLLELEIKSRIQQNCESVNFTQGEGEERIKLISATHSLSLSHMMCSFVLFDRVRKSILLYVHSYIRSNSPPPFTDDDDDCVVVQTASSSLSLPIDLALCEKA